MAGGDDYVGIDVHRAARIASAAHGGQVLVSGATHGLVAGALPAGTSLRRLGEYKLRDLSHAEQLFQLVIDGLPADFPPIVAAGVAGTGNLPPRIGPLIGRELELEALDSLLRHRRLVTLTGPGGIGKTSLALETARRVADRHPEGAWFVPLEAISDPAYVVPTIAGAIGLLEAADQPAIDRLGDYLRERTTLLVLDNLEQVADAATDIGRLLDRAPNLTVLATSRSPLRLAPEQEFAVPALAAPGQGQASSKLESSPAVQLFVERARRVRPGYDLRDEAEAIAVGEICRLLDGLPLGIQLAASRVGLLPARSIASRLGEHLPLPGAGARDVPDRQRSVEQAIAWSEQLLDPAARSLLASLSVFRGGFRLEEAEIVAARDDVLDELSQLVDQSLVQPTMGPDGARYRLLEPIRAYAASRLAEDEAALETGRRHALAYLALVEAAAPHMPGGGQLAWLNRLTAEHDNLRAAVAWMLDHGETELALRFGAAAWRFWQLSGHLAEGNSTMSRILEMPGADAPSPVRVRALAAAGGLHYWSADIPGADVFYAMQRQVAEAVDDRPGLADALFNLGHTRWLLTLEHEEADALADEAAALYEQLGDEGAAARLIWTRLNRDLLRQVPGTEEAMLESLIRFRELGDEWYTALVLGTLAWIAFGTGRILDAIRWGLASITAHHVMGDVASPTIALRTAASLFHIAGKEEEAATVAAAYDALSDRYGVQPPALFEELTPGLDPDAMKVDVDRYPDAVARGAAMTLDEVIDFLTRVSADLIPRTE
jgi:predicted ATPase